MDDLLIEKLNKNKFVFRSFKINAFDGSIEHIVLNNFFGLGSRVCTDDDAVIDANTPRCDDGVGQRCSRRCYAHSKGAEHARGV